MSTYQHIGMTQLNDKVRAKQIFTVHYIQYNEQYYSLRQLCVHNIIIKCHSCFLKYKKVPLFVKFKLILPTTKPLQCKVFPGRVHTYIRQLVCMLNNYQYQSLKCNKAGNTEVLSTRIASYFLSKQSTLLCKQHPLARMLINKSALAAGSETGKASRRETAQMKIDN